MSKNEWHICSNVCTHSHCRCCQLTFWVNSMYKTRQMLKEHMWGGFYSRSSCQTCAWSIRHAWWRDCGRWPCWLTQTMGLQILKSFWIVLHCLQWSRCVVSQAAYQLGGSGIMLRRELQVEEKIVDCTKKDVGERKEMRRILWESWVANVHWRCELAVKIMVGVLSTVMVVLVSEAVYRCICCLCPSICQY